jgi:hypothetical protein
MIGGMIIEDIANKIFLIDIIMIHQGTRPEEHMHIQGQREAQVCPLSEDKRGGMSHIYCKERLGSSSHQPLMVNKKGKMMLKPSFLES